MKRGKIDPKQSYNFDELKNKDYTYHYSREERLNMKRQNIPVPESQKPVRGILKFFRGNKGAMMLFFTMLALTIFFWIYYYLYSSQEVLEKSRVFTFAKGQKVIVKLIHNANRHGLNLNFKNRSLSGWTGQKIEIQMPGYTLSTNLNIDIEKGDEDILFIDTPAYVTNISKMTLQIE